MPSLFHHSHDDQAAEGVSPPGAPADPPAQMASLLEHFAGLSMAQRAAELFQEVAAKIDSQDGSRQMDALLAGLVPEFAIKQPDQYYSDRATLELTVCEAFQALVLARLLVCSEETDNIQGTNAFYYVSADGKAALDSGDVAEVVARRLPD